MKLQISLCMLLLSTALLQAMDGLSTSPKVQRLHKEVANKPPYEVKRIAHAKLNEYTEEKSEYKLALKKVEELIKDISEFRTILEDSQDTTTESTEGIKAGTDFYNNIRFYLSIKELELENALQVLRQRRLQLDKQLPAAVYKLLQALKAGGADRN
jgi:hypothetical protein